MDTQKTRKSVWLDATPILRVPILSICMGETRSVRVSLGLIKMRTLARVYTAKALTTLIDRFTSLGVPCTLVIK